MRIAFFTTTRAEFGIMSSFIHSVEKHADFESLLFVGGTHLKSEFGNTIDEILKMNFTITDTFDYIQNGDSQLDIAKSAGQCSLEVAKLFDKYDFDIVSILGDRYELIPIALTAILFNKPIIHWGGGEFTEGAIDNQIRQMLTKASHIHFVAAEMYAKNIIDLGEEKKRICITGSPVIETFSKTTPIPKAELFNDLALKADIPIVLLTYHPVTIEFAISPLEQIKNIFEALKKFNFQIVITAPNLEVDRKIILDYIMEQVSENSNMFFFESLGIKRYLSLIPYCAFLIGNSSSGIFEAPYFKVPTVNIGDRQKGRYLHKSIINANYSVDTIVDCIRRAVSNKFRNKISQMKYEFGDGEASEKAIAFLKTIKINEQLLRK